MNIDIATTSACNYGCKYCSEGLYSDENIRARIKNAKSKVSPESIKILLNNVRARHPNENIVIGFWGGEPLLNWQFCKDVMNALADDTNVTFLYYSNGYFIKRYLNELIEFKSRIGASRILMQISYDGRAINDIVRVTKDGRPTSDICLEAHRLLKENGFNVKFKSTLPIDHCDKLFECFKEFVTLGESYFPTPDVARWYDVDTIDQNMKALHANLVKIAQYIYDNKLQPDTFRWFTNSKAKCAAGCNYIALDVDGMVVPCHSAMYDGSDHRWGNVLDVDILDVCEHKFKQYEKMRAKIGSNGDCTKCDVLYCMTCPAHTYDLTHTGTYEDRWTSVNHNMCLVFKIADRVHKALKQSLKLNEFNHDSI